MQISDLMRHYNSAGTQPEPVIKSKGVERLVANLKELSKGNVFEGTVNSVKGGQVVLGLSNGQQITARLSGKISLTPGQSMFFQVKTNNGSQIEIKPYTVDGSGANLTLMQALKAAGLPTDANYLTMVDKMMEEQMPIDKGSLNEMAKLLQNNPGVDVTTLVQMQKLNIPITPEFASQFENYLGDKQAIGAALDELMDILPQSLDNQDLPLDQIKQMANEIIHIATEDNVIQPKIEDAPTLNNIEKELAVINGEDESSFVIDINDDVMVNTLDGDEVVVNGHLVMTEGSQESVATEGQDIQNEGQLSEEEQLLNSNGEIIEGELEEGELVQGEEASVVNKEPEGPVIPNTLKSIMTPEDLNKFVAQLKDTFPQLPENFALDGNKGVASTLLDLSKLLSTSGFDDINGDSLKQLLSGDAFKNMIKDSFGQQWLINPSDVAKGNDDIKKLYQKLETQMTKLEDIMKAAGQNNTNITDLTSNIRSNIEFMNQINEAYTYVQIPLKMSGQSANGELFVYTNKKSLAEGDKELSAFLHLDMDNLGPTDVSVRMLHKEVKTRFYLENDEAYDLVEKFLPTLEKRLAEKGYSCKFEVSNEGKHTNFVEDFLKKDQPSAGQLHRYSFDMRA